MDLLIQSVVASRFLKEKTMDWKGKIKTAIYFFTLLLRSAFFGVVTGVKYGWKTAMYYWRTERIKRSRTRPSDMRKTGGI